MSGVAVDILSGFLGSGKTTLLRHALTHGLRGQRIAVIMNEIGAVGIDGRVVRGLANVERMVELSNGCICCTIDDYRFDRAVQEILDTARPHAMIIETTGLADPAALSARVVACGLRVDAITTVVDAGVAAAQLDDLPILRQQVEVADFLVINKIDLQDPASLDHLGARLRTLNPRAAQWRAERGAIDAALLFATGATRHRPDNVTDDCHLLRDGFGSFVYRTADCLDAATFTAVLAKLPAQIVRAKGVVRFDDDDASYLVNFTCGRYEIVPLPAALGDGGQMVFIGRDIDGLAASIRAALDDCASGARRAPLAISRASTSRPSTRRTENHEGTH